MKPFRVKGLGFRNLGVKRLWSRGFSVKGLGPSAERTGLWVPKAPQIIVFQT